MCYKTGSAIIILLLSSVIAQATHLRAGQITTKQNGLTVTILVEVWTNDFETQARFGGDGDILDFGDGHFVLVPETQNQSQKPGSPPLPEHVKYASYTITHTYDAVGDYIISYREKYRNIGVLNMANSGGTEFYLETKIVIDPFYGDNYSPYLAIDPIDKACTGVMFTHNPGANDPNIQDSISFSMEIPYSDSNTAVENYRDPNTPGFYAGLDYPHANEDQTAPPTFDIDPVTGMITWDAPGAAGEYNIAFHVIEWRKVFGVWKQIGYVRRDMQIIVQDCNNNDRPELQIPRDTCVIAGTKLDATIIAKDNNHDPIKIEAFSPVFNVFIPPATISPDPGPNDFRPSPATTYFTWETNCSAVKDQPYAVIFKVTDKPAEGPPLATYKAWLITVVGPAPLWISDVEGVGYTRNPVNRSVTVNWQDYTCSNVEYMQVWRKVDGSAFEPSTCETGMPPYLGYELIDTVLIGQTSYTDSNKGKGLIPGAQYCYRLVAVFPPNTGSESLVSQDLCIEPFKITNPVITNVSVIETRNSDGKILIKWVPPLESESLPPDYPYTYKIFRQAGFTAAFQQVGITSNLSFDDQVTELNTQNIVYNYYVAAYVNSNDTDSIPSAAASTVRLEARSRLNRIELEWSAEVPWSNNIEGLKHNIYRLKTDDRPVALADFDPDPVTPGVPVFMQVDITQGGFVFIDNTDLEQKQYCYLVETYGSYGSGKLPSPLINQSQIICAEPGDDVPPCKPTGLTAENENCKNGTLASTCAPSDFTNTLKWDIDESDCGADIDYYQVYFSNSSTSNFILLADHVRGSEYVDKGDLYRTSFAGCYKVLAIDRSGNPGPASDPVCVDNCPYYELPNVFTPNNDGCNDLFSAYSDRDHGGDLPGPEQCVTPMESKMKCARFVEKVEFKVFNRWGREVYSYVGENTKEHNIWIDWDGKSSDGRLLSTGVYYYIADVTFNSIDPANKYKTLKGTIHLLRGQDN